MNERIELKQQKDEEDGTRQTHTGHRQLKIK